MSKKAQKRQIRRRRDQRQLEQQRHRPGNPERAAELRRWKANKQRSERQPRPEPEPPGWYLPELGLTRQLEPMPPADWGRLPAVIRTHRRKA